MIISNRGRLTAALAAIALGVAAYAAAQAQTPSGATGVGPFTQAQVDAGRAAYKDNCAGCHGAALAGGPNATALSGPGFMGRWSVQTTADFYHYMSTTMPYGDEGKLGADIYTNIAAYIYAANGARPGAQTYAPDTVVPLAGLVNGEVVGSVVNPPTQTAQAGRGAARTDEDGNPIAAPGRGAAAPGRGSVFGQTVTGTVANYVDVTDAMLTHPSDGDWLMARRTYQGWSYSPLNKVTPANVKTLQLKWTWNMYEGGANQPTPIVHNGIMFLANAQNVIQALDAKTGRLIWENRIGPDVSRAYYGNRSIGLWHDKVYTATSDAHLVALDARTGKLVWKVEIGPPPKGETGGVIVIKGKVLVGLMGCDNYSTDHCYISAFDAQTGQRDWKFYTTALNGTPGGDTWHGLDDNFKGGVDTWIAGTYDPDLNTTYWGTAQAKPWFRASRRTFGDAALYSASTLALDPDTGKLKWYYQHIPGESLDLDEVFERVLIDHGKQKTVMTIGKSGILWKLDRESGKFLKALPTIFQNVYQKLDVNTGEIEYRDDILNQKTNQWLSSCPSPEGGHNWQATSYNQPTDLLIIPESQSCVMIAGRDVDLKLGGGGTAASQTFYFMPGTHRQMGRLTAVNTSSMKIAWTWQQQAPFLTAALSTKSGVAFIGDFDRVFHAVDVRTGKQLWSTRLGNTVQGYPVSFSIGGKQYIAVTTGLGGGSPEQKPSLLLENYVKRASTGQTLYVFGLPE
jgi:alcohol dehydrogenase (cytochrome c)